MEDIERLCLWTCVGTLAFLVAVLARRVASVEEDLDLDKVPAGNPGSLLEAKRAIEKRRAERAAERGEA